MEAGSMIHESFDDISIATIQRLIADGMQERRDIDYKQDLPKFDDSGKKELLKDASSFANAHGGHLIFGVAEEDGRPTAIYGITENKTDGLILRLESVIHGGIEPRLEVRTKELKDEKGSVVIVMYIPRSWNVPHRVCFNTPSTFYSRASNGKVWLDVHQIRQAFESATGIERRLRDFRDGRLAKIIANETPVPLKSEGATVVLHVLPLSAFDRPRRLNAGMLSSQYGSYRILACDAARSEGRLVNFDGVASYGVDRDRENLGYTQTFYSGCIEAVDKSLINPRQGGNGYRFVDMRRFALFTVKQGKSYFNFLRACNVQPPFIVCLTLIGLAGVEVANPNHSDDHAMPIDRDLLLLPEVYFDDYPARLGPHLQVAFDSLWQASGHIRCALYDEAGNLNGDDSI